MSFAHLHVHTEYSLLDGACRIEPMLDKVKSMGQTSVAITDHGNMYGVLKFYKEAIKRGLNPIIGCEVYVAPRGLKDKVHGIDSERFHLILLCKNNEGYKNLIKIVSESWINGFYTKPRVDKELLAKYHEGIIALSGCLFGEVSQKLINNDFDGACEVASWYNSVFGEGNYYIEIQNHGLDEQTRINPDLIKLSNKLNIPLAATNDVHYIDKEDSKIQQVLICIQTNHILGEDTGLEFGAQEFYLKNEEEMIESFYLCPEAVENTAKIAEKCHVDFEFGKTKLPHFDVPDGYDHFDWFKQMCEKGLIKRYGSNPPQEYIDRMNYELEVINTMGYTDYYLIVHDFINYAKSVGIPVGPGRGSGAASICAYFIGITGIDPMKYNLLFERFLNPERVSMPDFDIDFCFERRGEVIDYVIRKYGYDHVAQIVTFGTMAAKAAIRDVGRAMGMPYGDVDLIAKLIPRELNITIKEALEQSKELKQIYDTNISARELIDTSIKIEGMPRHASTHAAGVVITADPVNEYVPLALNDNSVVTQFTMKDLEQLGLLKMDFLGLRTLTVIRSAEKLIKEKNPSFDIDKIDIDDKKVLKLFAAGNTDGVFQFESPGIKRVLQQLNPTSIEDIIAVIALYRPGPIETEAIPKYIKNRNNPSAIKYDTPLLKNILDVTYGSIVYQEQVMQICREVAGYSFGRADIVRRAMAKKQLDVMLQERNNFVYGITDEDGNVVCDGAVRRGVSPEVANDLFDQMVAFASYAFNKAHAAAYAFVSYQTAYLKCYYPKEFFASLLSSFIDRTDKISGYIKECNKLGIKILPPHINNSSFNFGVNDDGIIFSLSAVKNVGPAFVSRMIEERKSNGKFISFYDFCERMYGRDLNRKTLESLIKCGAVDMPEANRRQMLLSLDEIIDGLDKKKKNNLDGQIGFGDLSSPSGEIIDEDFSYQSAIEFSNDEKLRFEKEVTGLYLSGHIMDKYKDYYKPLNCDFIQDIKTDDIRYKDNTSVTILALISAVNKKISKNNKQIAFIEVEDTSDSIECIAFSKPFEQFRDLIFEGNAVILRCKVSTNDDAPPSLIVDTIEAAPSSVPEKQTESVKQINNKPKCLFLRFDSEKSPQVNICKNLISIFDGPTKVMLYFSDKKEYVNFGYADVNDVLLRELNKILSSANVIFK